MLSQEQKKEKGNGLAGLLCGAKLDFTVGLLFVSLPAPAPKD